ncbi:MAG: hypothetical protein KDD60_10215, partial [Bdellovibrionales bacterium]|nr:hypothetical protein [Bdellovibrionales bacterium]
KTRRPKMAIRRTLFLEQIALNTSSTSIERGSRFESCDKEFAISRHNIVALKKAARPRVCLAGDTLATFVTLR